MTPAFYMLASGFPDEDDARARELADAEQEWASMELHRGDDRTEGCPVCGAPDVRRCCENALREVRASRENRTEARPGPVVCLHDPAPGGTVGAGSAGDHNQERTVA